MAIKGYSFTALVKEFVALLGRKINGKPLTADVTITKADIGLPDVKNVSLNWTFGTSNPTLIWGSQGDSIQSYVYTGSQLKTFVGLNEVSNWPATAAINDSSNVKYSTAGAVKQAYDKGVEALSKANAALPNTGGSINGNVHVQGSLSAVDLAVPYDQYIRLNQANAGFGWGIREESSTGRMTFEGRVGVGAFLTKFSLDIGGQPYVGSSKVFHQAFPPTAAQVGLPNVKNVSLNWTVGTQPIVYLWGSQGDDVQSYVYTGEQVRVFAGAAPKPVALGTGTSVTVNADYNRMFRLDFTYQDGTYPDQTTGSILYDKNSSRRYSSCPYWSGGAARGICQLDKTNKTLKAGAGQLITYVVLTYLD